MTTPGTFMPEIKRVRIGMRNCCSEVCYQHIYTVYTYDMQHIHYITNHPIWGTLFSNKPNHWQPNLWGTLPISVSRTPSRPVLEAMVGCAQTENVTIDSRNTHAKRCTRMCTYCVYIKYTLNFITLRYVTLRYITHVHTQIQSQNKYTHLFMLHYTYTYMHTIGVAQSIVLEHHPSIVSSEIRSMQNPCRRRRHHHHHQQHHGST